jgi:hypothetical protein
LNLFLEITEKRCYHISTYQGQSSQVYLRWIPRKGLQRPVDVGFKPTGTEVEMRYMQSWEIEDIRFEQGVAQGHASGLAEGLTQGESKGKMDSILLLLSNLEEISEDLKIKIQAQQDQKVLDQWLVYAAKAKSIPEFEESIKQQ